MWFIFTSSNIYLVHCRHQTFFSLLDRFRATVADSSSPSPPVTTHPLDGEPPPAPELVVADKVRGAGKFIALTFFLS